MAKVPYKIQLSEQEIPKYWYNVRADMQTDCIPIPVSYTHLDVYKRQLLCCAHMKSS